MQTGTLSENSQKVFYLEEYGFLEEKINCLKKQEFAM